MKNVGQELEKQLTQEKEGISVWFEEIGFEYEEINNFIYATEYENKTEYMKCQVTDEYDDYFKDAPPGVYLIFNDEGSQMEIRKMRQEEISLIARHYEEIMKKQFKKIGEEPITEDRYKIILKKNFKDSCMFVLEDNGIKSFIWFIKKDGEINLEELFSIEKGRGYGNKLVRFLLDYSRKEKIKKINMDVHFKNKKALRFFKRFGFTERTIELSLEI